MGERNKPQEVKFWRAKNLADLELALASYHAQQFPRHFHAEYVIGVMVRGRERVVHRGTVYTAPQGSLILFNPGEPHASSSVDEGGFARRMLYPPASMLQRVLYDITGRELSAPFFPKPIVPDQYDDVHNSLVQFHTALEQPASKLEQESRFIAVMTRLIVRLAVDCPPAPRFGREDYHVKSIRDYLHAHYLENVSLAQLSSITNLSSYHLLRVFRNETGLPPYEYQNQLRIGHAKKLLREGKAIAQVALESGYVDQSHLTRHFKRVVGVTPGKYVNSNNVQDSQE